MERIDTFAVFDDDLEDIEDLATKIEYIQPLDLSNYKFNPIPEDNPKTSSAFLQREKYLDKLAGQRVAEEMKTNKEIKILFMMDVTGSMGTWI